MYINQLVGHSHTSLLCLDFFYYFREIFSLYQFKRLESSLTLYITIIDTNVCFKMTLVILK